MSETDQTGAVTMHYYDIRGNEVATVDPLGQRELKFYDLADRLVEERNAVGDAIRYTYDAFGRRITIRNGLDQTITQVFDQRDRLRHVTDGMGHVTRYDYDGRDNRIWTYDPRWSDTSPTYKFGQEYDGLGRVITAISYQDGVEIRERRVYDLYGNLIAEMDGEGRIKSKVFGGFGRLLQEVDEGGDVIAYAYDIYGRREREYDPNGDKDIWKTYDAAGNLTRIEDLATGVTTEYGYDIAGNRVYEYTTTPIDVQGESTHNRQYTYEYDSRGDLVRWHDAVTGLHMSYIYDAAGNLRRAYTDEAYDPDNKNTDADPNYRFVDHLYQYDAANRVTQISQGTTLISGYGYDAAGNRTTWNNAGTLVTYVFNAAGRVTEGTWISNGTAYRQAWQYDAAGNVLDFRTYENGSQTLYKTYQYFENNKNWYSDDDGQVTTYSFDKSGRTLQMVLKDDGSTYYYDYTHHADGRTQSIKAHGDATGNSTFTYDANENQIKVDLGQGDSQDRPEVTTLVYNNEGKIIYKYHDDGEHSTRGRVEYAYANGHPVGETGTNAEGEQATKLDVSNYALVQNMGEDYPGTAITQYTVSEGDSLQSIAAALYGNPSLWFVLAGANSLRGDESLKAGTVLTVPNTVQTGRITADTHALYKDSDIIGSTLPNLVAPPQDSGGGGGCGGLFAILIVVVIAVVAAAFVGPLAGALLQSAFGAALTGAVGATLATAITYAVAGAVVYAAANIVQQGLFIALGYQDSFEWGQVGAAAVSGLFSGAAAGVGKAAAAAAKAGKAASTLQHMKIAAAALEVAGAAAKQLITDGKITSWTSLAAAGIGGYIQTGQAIEGGRLAGAEDVVNSGTASQDAVRGSLETARSASKEIARLQDIARTVKYVTPWVQLAETYVRNDGKLQATDWASAVGATLGTAVSSPAAPNTFGDRLYEAAKQMGVNLLVAGALAKKTDRATAENFFYNVVGQEVGQVIGSSIAGYIGTQLAPELPRSGARYDATLDTFVDEKAGAAYDPELGLFVDKRGNPVSYGGLEAPRAPFPFGGSPIDQNASNFGIGLGPVGGTGAGGGVGGIAPPTGPTIEPYKVQAGDSYWRIAARQLGPGATDADIQQQVYALMQLNQGLDPRKLQLGQEIRLVDPNSGVVPDSATLAAYAASDAEYQADLAARQQAMAAATSPSILLPAADGGASGLSMMFAGAPSMNYLGVSMQSAAFAPTAIAPRPAEEPSLLNRFGRGLLGAIEAVTVEPLRQGRDLVLAGSSVVYNELIRDEGEEYWFPQMISDTARAYEGGASQTRLILQSNPFTGVGVLSYDATTAAREGRWGDVAEMGGGLFGGFLTGKVTSKYGGYGVRLGDIEASGPLASQAGAIKLELVTPGAEAAATVPRGGTYVLRDESGNVVRSGRTNDFIRREGEHFRDPDLRDYTFEPVHRTDVYAEQRGLEQLLHETYQPTLNKINPISPKNPNRNRYLEAAESYLNQQR